MLPPSHELRMVVRIIKFRDIELSNVYLAKVRENFPV
jgi:hypothetical protein